MLDGGTVKRQRLGEWSLRKYTFVARTVLALTLEVQRGRYGAVREEVDRVVLEARIARNLKAEHGACGARDGERLEAVEDGVVHAR